jgi:hypothetical protein
MSRGGSGATKTDLRLYAILVVGLACWLLQLLAPPTLFGTCLSIPYLPSRASRHRSAEFRIPRDRRDFLDSGSIWNSRIKDLR